jgi:hypothetical protein
MLGFRLIDGFDQNELSRLIEQDPLNAKHRTHVISTAIEDGELLVEKGRICFSRSGILMADRFLSDLIVCDP